MSDWQYYKAVVFKGIWEELASQHSGLCLCLGHWHPISLCLFQSQLLIQLHAHAYPEGAVGDTLSTWDLVIYVGFPDASPGLVFTWPRPVHSDHLGSEPMDKRSPPYPFTSYLRWKQMFEKMSIISLWTQHPTNFRTISSHRTTLRN